MSLILNSFLYMLTETSVSNNKDQPKQNKKQASRHKKRIQSLLLQFCNYFPSFQEAGEERIFFLTASDLYQLHSGLSRRLRRLAHPVARTTGREIKNIHQIFVLQRPT